jgi:hypothetical protein
MFKNGKLLCFVDYLGRNKVKIMFFTVNRITVWGERASILFIVWIRNKALKFHLPFDVSCFNCM